MWEPFSTNSFYFIEMRPFLQSCKFTSRIEEFQKILVRYADMIYKTLTQKFQTYSILSKIKKTYKVIKLDLKRFEYYKRHFWHFLKNFIFCSSSSVILYVNTIWQSFHQNMPSCCGIFCQIISFLCIQRVERILSIHQVDMCYIISLTHDLAE